MLNQPIDDIMEMIERMEHDDRESLLDALATLVPSVREAREALRNHPGRELLRQQEEEEREEPPPIYEDATVGLPTYGDIEDSPPDYIP